MRTFFLALFLLLLPAQPAWPQAQPNIVLFLVDDLGLMDTSVPMLTDAQGQPQAHPLNRFYRTPNMQRLAEQGIRFSDFYAQSVCSPSRVSIMTGQNATRHRTTTWINPANNNHGRFGPRDWNWQGLDEHSVTLPRLLQAAGYRTLFVGKGHFGPRNHPGADPLNLGFDRNVAGFEAGRPGSYFGEHGYGLLQGDRSRAVPHLEAYHGTTTFLTEALTLEANTLIREAVADETPFFLYMSHYAVHSPFHVDPRFIDHYADSNQPDNVRAFAALAEGMDKSLGDLMDQLEQLGVAENTLIIFLGDNGSAAPIGSAHDHGSSAPLRGMKGTEFEGGMRVPFIAAWSQPNPEHPSQQRLPIAQGEMQTQLGTVMDLFPTLLALAGATSPAEHVHDGHDLSVQFAGQANPDRPETFLMHFPHEHRTSYFTVFRQGSWKLVYRYRPRQSHAPGIELYNLANDPGERHNVAGEHPDRVQSMLRDMASQLEAEQALYPVNANGNSLRPQVD